jgi:hypothetical protein
MNKNLSPAAQQVLDAAWFSKYLDRDDVEVIVASALCAVADFVAPYETEVIDNCYYEVKNPVREQLLSIAAELKGA